MLNVLERIKMKKIVNLLLTLMILFSMTGCQKNTETEEEHLLIAAAASLKNVYEDELIPMFIEDHENVVIEGTYDSSGKLQTQIEAGLEADIFMSAAKKQMNALNDNGYIKEGSIVDLLENKIVLITPIDSELGLVDFEDITKASIIAIGDPESVPAGQYAKEALDNLGIYPEIEEKISFGTNVTEVLNQVAEASAEAGIVYATDAASMSDKVKIIAEAPEGSLEKPVIYPIAVIENSKNQELAQEFIDFLKTDKAIAIFEKYGFTGK